MDCIIIASGNLFIDPRIKLLLKEADLIIAADGGAAHLKQIDIPPHIIIGDMDSIDQDTRNFFKKNQIPMITHPARKDKTDTELCIDFAVKKGASRITMLGVTGTRLDHTLANIFLMEQLADRKIDSRIIDANNEIYLVKDSLKLTGKKGELLSLIPISSRVEGLTLKGLEYPLKNACLPMGSSLGISNYFKETRVSISLKAGVLLVTKSRD
jgi:thiamine pyrophosphokinase